MVVSRPGMLAAAPLLLALLASATEVFEMKDARMCKGYEKAYAKCDNLPSCTKACEPRDCAFGDWGAWYDAGGCSGLCHRHRGLLVANNECGAPCVGSKAESKECPKAECLLQSEDCVLSTWSEWSECTSKIAQKYRYRNVVTNPSGVGRACGGNLNETAPCEQKLPLDCAFSDWGSWTPCSASCGGGYHAALRRVKRRAQNGGAACEGSLRRTRVCNPESCPDKKVDCEIGLWSEWAGCDFASPHQRYRTRDVKTAALGGGTPCSDVMKQTVGCPKEPPVDCELSDWSAWGKCDQECGGGQMFRERKLATPPSNGGSCSSAQLHETTSCNQHACTTARACAVSVWSEWGACSATCDRGMRQRSRELLYGEEARRRLSILDMFSDVMVEAQNRPPLENCTGGYNGQLKSVEPCQAQPCARQDCHWGLWSEWSTCSATCGGGTTRRKREVAVVAGPGGKPCEPQDMSQVTKCNTELCNQCINGAWGDWAEWSVCSASCGDGFRSRHRDVMQHPNDCGKPVSGVEDEYEKCQASGPCEQDADCQLSEWSAWTECSTACFGVTERHREVVKFPVGAGKSCKDEPLKQMDMCNPKVGDKPPMGCEGSVAPTACQLDVWGDWSSCSASCGSGQHVRLRHLLSPATKGGELCNGTLRETRPCADLPCPTPECQDCKYSDWSAWSPCAKCGGQRYRHRSVEQVANECGRPCDVEHTKETDQCKSECEDVQFCAWSEWSQYGECSAECGPAIKSRQRVLTRVDQEPLAFLFSGTKGMSCMGTQLDSAPCEFRSCDHTCEPSDCELGEWTEWSLPSCSQLCERTRVIKTEGRCGGNLCSAHLDETKSCPHSCAEKQDCLLSAWGAWSPCRGDRDQRYRQRAIEAEGMNGGNACAGSLSETQSCSSPGLPMPCELSTWSAWSTCTKSCLGGMKQRKRSVRVSAINGGAPCGGAMEELTVCNQVHCATEKRDCAISAWSEWSTCQSGQRTRARNVEEPTNGGLACDAAMQELQECRWSDDCQLSEWSEWAACDKTCAGGQQGRQRQVVQNPHFGGRACEPDLIQTRGCNPEPCNKVDCEVGDWGAWGACSASCGPGQRARERKVAQEPEDGGLGCGLELRQLEPCSAVECEFVDCLWSEWEDWSSCSASCAGGQRSRARAVLQPPQKGGKACEPLSKEEVVPCNTFVCSVEKCVDGAWGEWSAWEKCSKSCRGGVTWRTRPVIQEANHCGRPAVGSARVYASCNEEIACEPAIDCQLSSWGDWSTCSSDCEGVRRRERSVAVEGRGAGEFCVGTLKETSPCHPAPGSAAPEGCGPALPQDCTVAEWGEWEACSVSCGGGSQVRHRNLLTEPKNGGECAETLSEVNACGRAPCSAKCEPQDCKFGDWEEWSVCDKCGGQTRRFRHVNQEAACGGSPCEAAASEETQNCTRQCHLPVYCTWGDWEEWGNCSAACGSAEKSRARHLKVTTNLDVINEFDATFADEEMLQEKVHGLQMKAAGLKTRKVQELTMAFACGGVSLIMGMALVRVGARYTGRRKEFTRVDLAGDQ